MRNIAQRKIEEDKLMMKVLLEENDYEKDLALIDFRFMQRCMNIMKANSLMPQVRYRKGRHRQDVHDEILNMVDLALQECEEAGYIFGEEVELKKSEIKYFLLNFSFEYKKQKGSGKKKRIHIDKASFLARDRQDAETMLRNRLKKLGEELIEIVNCTHKVKSVMTINNELININLVRLI